MPDPGLTSGSRVIPRPGLVPARWESGDAGMRWHEPSESCVEGNDGVVGALMLSSKFAGRRDAEVDDCVGASNALPTSPLCRYLAWVLFQRVITVW